MVRVRVEVTDADGNHLASASVSFESLNAVDAATQVIGAVNHIPCCDVANCECIKVDKVGAWTNTDTDIIKCP